MGPRLAPAQSISPVTPVLSSWMNASGAGSVWSTDHVTVKGSVSARIASMAGGSRGGGAGGGRGGQGGGGGGGGWGRGGGEGGEVKCIHDAADVHDLPPPPLF